LSDQFVYRVGIADEQTTGTFLAIFRRSFGILGFMAADISNSNRSKLKVTKTVKCLSGDESRQFGSIDGMRHHDLNKELVRPARGSQSPARDGSDTRERLTGRCRTMECVWWAAIRCQRRAMGGSAGASTAANWSRQITVEVYTGTFRFPAVQATACDVAGSSRSRTIWMRRAGYVIVRHGATNRDQADTDPLHPENISKQRVLSDNSRSEPRVTSAIGERDSIAA
jgi:hypothetical protein